MKAITSERFDRVFTWIVWIACLAGAVCLLSCTSPNSPSGKNGYTLMTGEITNGVAIVFESVPSDALVQRLTAVGAEVSDPPTAFVLRVVDTDAKREALTAALIAGAHLKGAP